MVEFGEKAGFLPVAARREARQTTDARECFIACYLLARELNYRRGEADALNLAALCYLELGSLDQGMELMEGSRKLNEDLGDADGQAEDTAVAATPHRLRGTPRVSSPANGQ